MERLRFFLIMLAAVVTLAAGETFISRGMRQSGDRATGWLDGARAAASNGWAISGAVLLGLHLGLDATALAVSDLSLVMPLTAASYPLGVLLARFFLHEEVNLARWAGTTVIAVGVALVAWGEAKPAP